MSGSFFPMSASFSPWGIRSSRSISRLICCLGNGSAEKNPPTNHPAFRGFEFWKWPNGDREAQQQERIPRGQENEEKQEDDGHEEGSQGNEKRAQRHEATQQEDDGQHGHEERSQGHGNAEKEEDDGSNGEENERTHGEENDAQ